MRARPVPSPLLCHTHEWDQEAPRLNALPAWAARRLLVVVCDLKVLLYELGSKQVREVSKAALEGKSAGCCAFLLLGGKVSRRARVQ